MHYTGDEQGGSVAQQLQAPLQVQVQMKSPPAPAAIGPARGCCGAEGLQLAACGHGLSQVAKSSDLNSDAGIPQIRFGSSEYVQPGSFPAVSAPGQRWASQSDDIHNSTDPARSAALATSDIQVLIPIGGGAVRRTRDGTIDDIAS